VVRSTYLRLRPLPILGYSGFQPFLDQPYDPLIRYPYFHQLDQPFMTDIVEEAPDIGVQYPAHFLRHDPHR